MKKVYDSLLIVIVGTALAVSMANCSGCALVQPEGEMTMEVDNGQQ